jgi:hypothetical protein
LRIFEGCSERCASARAGVQPVEAGPVQRVQDAGGGARHHHLLGVALEIHLVGRRHFVVEHRRRHCHNRSFA